MYSFDPLASSVRLDASGLQEEVLHIRQAQASTQDDITKLLAEAQATRRILFGVQEDLRHTRKHIESYFASTPAGGSSGGQAARQLMPPDSTPLSPLQGNTLRTSSVERSTTLRSQGAEPELEEDGAERMTSHLNLPLPRLFQACSERGGDNGGSDEGDPKKSTSRSLQSISCRPDQHAVTYLTKHLLHVPQHGAAIQLARSSCVVHPASRIALAVDLIKLVMLVIDLAATPYILAFDNVYWNDTLENAAAGFACMWVALIVIHCRVGFLDGGGGVELRPYKIFLRYAKTWLIWDLLPVLCTTTALGWRGAFGAGDHGSLFLRRLFAVHLVRVARLINIVLALWERCFSSQVKKVIEGVSVLFALLWVNHVISCGFAALGLADMTDTGIHWIDAHIDSSLADSYRDENVIYQYLSALHWAFTQMTPGSMQVNPRNSYERAYAVVTLVIGMLMQASIISGLSSRILHWRIRTMEWHTSLTTLRRFLTERQVDNHIALRVQRQIVERMMSTKPLTPQDVPVLGMLSKLLRAELNDEVCRSHAIRYPFFRLVEIVDDEGGKLIHDLCGDAVEFVVLQAGDSAFVHSNTADFMYLFLSGVLTYRLRQRMRLSSSRRASTAILKDAGSGGETEEKEKELVPAGTCLAEAALWMQSWTHTGTAESQSVCEILNVNPAKCLEYFGRSPNISFVAHDYRSNFQARLQTHARDATDLAVPFCDHGAIVLSLSVDSRTIIGEAALGLLQQVKVRRLQPMEVASLEAEISNGQCTVLLTMDEKQQEEVVRMVAVTVLRLQDKDGRILVKLGNLVNGRPECDVKIPGLKQTEGELPDEALVRLCEQDLAALRPLEVGSADTEATMKTSASVGVRTLYLKTIFRCSLGDSYVQPEYISSVTKNKSSPMLHTQKSEGSQSQHSQTLNKWGRLSTAGYGKTTKSTSSHILACDAFLIQGGHNSRTLIVGWMHADDADWVTETTVGEAAVDELLKALDFKGSMGGSVTGSVAVTPTALQNGAGGQQPPGFFPALHHTNSMGYSAASMSVVNSVVNSFEVQPMATMTSDATAGGTSSPHVGRRFSDGVDDVVSASVGKNLSMDETILEAPAAEGSDPAAAEDIAVAPVTAEDVVVAPVVIQQAARSMHKEFDL